MAVRTYRHVDERVKEYCEVLKFWSNGIGELHCPHKVGMPDITEDELPEELQRVYRDLYWEPNAGASLRYMVETDKGYGIALLNEYDRVTAENSGVDFGPLFETVIADGDNVANEKMFANCEVFAGERMGFDGCHELVVVLPWNISVDDFVQAAEKLDELVYVACGINKSTDHVPLTAEAVDSLVSNWLQEMRLKEGELIYAKNLDIESDDYKKFLGLVADLCQREFPDLYEAVFGDGAGTMDLIFRDKWQPDSCFKLFYYNPDSTAGGLIEECPFDVVDAAEMVNNEDYMDVLADRPHYLSDVNTEHFFETIFGLLEMKRDGLYLGCDVDEVCRKIEENSKGLMGVLAEAQEKSVRFVTESVVGIGDFVEDSEMKKGLNDSFVLRNRTLDVCYKIPGYEKLPAEEKKQLYDLVKKAVEKNMEMEKDLPF